MTDAKFRIKTLETDVNDYRMAANSANAAYDDIRRRYEDPCMVRYPRYNVSPESRHLVQFQFTPDLIQEVELGENANIDCTHGWSHLATNGDGARIYPTLVPIMFPHGFAIVRYNPKVMADMHLKAHVAFANIMAIPAPPRTVGDTQDPEVANLLYPPGGNQWGMAEENYKVYSTGFTTGDQPDELGAYTMDFIPYDPEPEGLEVPKEGKFTLKLPRYYVPMEYDLVNFKWKTETGGYWNFPPLKAPASKSKSSPPHVPSGTDDGDDTAQDGDSDQESHLGDTEDETSSEPDDEHEIIVVGDADDEELSRMAEDVHLAEIPIKEEPVDKPSQPVDAALLLYGTSTPQYAVKLPVDAAPPIQGDAEQQFQPIDVPQPSQVEVVQNVDVAPPSQGDTTQQSDTTQVEAVQPTPAVPTSLDQAVPGSEDQVPPLDKLP